MLKLLFLSLSATAVLAKAAAPLSGRQLVPIPCSEQGEKDCGDGCIPLTFTCCPDRAGGCPASAVCWLGTNGDYGCCPLGEICDGPGGASTRPGSTITLTETLSETSVETLTSTSTETLPTLTTESTTSSTAESSTAPTSTSQSTTTFVPPTKSSNGTSPTASHVTVNGVMGQYGSASLLQLFAASAAVLWVGLFGI